MQNANFTGNGLPSTRSINVRANLLTEWTTDQIRYRSEALRYVAIIAASVLVALISIPFMEGSRRNALPGIHQAQSELAELGSALSQADLAKKAVAPELAASELRAETNVNFSILLGQTYRVLNSANAGIVLGSAKAEVRAAEIVIDCKADAATFEAAQAFGQAAGIGEHKVSSVASIRPGGLFDNGGITFDYMKRVAIK